MGRADVYLQPHAPDPVLDHGTVLALARRHVHSAGAMIEVDESGGEARAYLLDGEIVVKTQRPHRLRVRTSLAKEAAVLARLAATDIADRIPRLYGYETAETPSGTVEYLCMSRMQGRAGVAAPPAPSQRRQVLADLAAVLRVVHTVSAAAAPAEVHVPVDTADGLRQRLDYWFADLGDIADPGPMPAPLADVASAAIGAVPDVLPPPVLLHSNPGLTHTFTDAATGRFTGIIDFGDSYISHPTMDLRSWPDPRDRIRLRDAYRDGGPDDPVFDRMWTVAMIYADAAALVNRTRYADAAAADLTMRLNQL